MENKRLKKTIRIISFLTVLCVLLIAFSGCSSLNGDVITSYEKGELSGKTLILTVGSTPVYWPEFHFWLNYIKKHYKKYHNLDEITDWSVEQNGMSLSEFFLSCAVGYACKDRAIEAKAKELGIKLSEDDLAEIEKKRESNIKIYSKSEYLRIVARMYVSEEVFNYLTKIDYLGKYLFESFYGANGEKCSDEDVSAYVKEKGIMCAKYIFLSNTDSDGNELSAEKRAKNYKLLENILGRLGANDAPPTLFDALMNEYGEDTTVSNYPDGRLFVSGSMGKEFESAYLKLKENEYSGIVKTDHGYYVILRKPIFPDMTAAGNTLRYWTAYEYLFKNQIDDWYAKMKIKYEDAYYKIDVKELPDN
jgi:hypothetical protein